MIRYNTHTLQDVLLLKATSQAAVQSVQDSLAMMNIQMGLLPPSGISPVHSTLSPINAQSPSRKVPLRHRRPMSMIDTSSKHHHNLQQYEEVENDLDDVVLRSMSVTEVGGARKKIVPKMTSKEAP